MTTMAEQQIRAAYRTAQTRQRNCRSCAESRSKFCEGVTHGIVQAADVMGITLAEDDA